MSFDGREWKQLPDPNTNIGGKFVDKIVPLKNGGIALSVAWNKVVLYKEGSFQQYLNPPWDFTIDQNDFLWIIVWDKDNPKYAFEKTGVARYDWKSTTWFPKEQFIFDAFLNITVDSDNTVWMTTIDGLWYYKQITTAVSDTSPSSLPMIGNTPNPFNPSTTISFSLPAPSHTSLSVYSITGQRIRTLISGPLSAGTHSVTWDGRDDSGKPVSSGVYLSRLTAGKQAAVGKMLLMR